MTTVEILPGLVVPQDWLRDGGSIEVAASLTVAAQYVSLISQRLISDLFYDLDVPHTPEAYSPFGSATLLTTSPGTADVPPRYTLSNAVVSTETGHVYEHALHVEPISSAAVRITLHRYPDSTERRRVLGAVGNRITELATGGFAARIPGSRHVH